jgi:hypothetical protein
VVELNTFDFALDVDGLVLQLPNTRVLGVVVIIWLFEAGHALRNIQVFHGTVDVVVGQFLLVEMVFELDGFLSVRKLKGYHNQVAEPELNLGKNHARSIRHYVFSSTHLGDALDVFCVA